MLGQKNLPDSRITFSYLLILSILIVVFSFSAGAEILVVNLNNYEYTDGESAKVYGYLLDDSQSGMNNTNLSVYDTVTSNVSVITTSDAGYFEHYINNLSSGSHRVTAYTSSSNMSLNFWVYPVSQKARYEIIAESLDLPYSDPELNFTVNKYLGSTLSSDSFNYSVFYENGTEIESLFGNGVSGISEIINLPVKAGHYIIVIDNKKSFNVYVSKFFMSFKITDSEGEEHVDVFKPDDIVYFEVQGTSQGQNIRNASVTATVTEPSGAQKTVLFSEENGIYFGDTNLTQTGSALQLTGGEYNVRFIMEDASGNRQVIKGFFTVLGLDVDVELVSKKSYHTGDSVEFEIIVRNLEDGTLIEHEYLSYSLELESEGRTYDVSGINVSAHGDSGYSSIFNMSVPSSSALPDGWYVLEVDAGSSGKKGKGHEFFEIMNNEVYMELSDVYENHRNHFKPGERSKINIESDEQMSLLLLTVYDDEGNQKLASNKTISNQTSAYLEFNAPQQSGDYLAEAQVVLDSNITATRTRWFWVQNYISFMDIKNQKNAFQFVHPPNSTFLTEINVFDIGSSTEADLTDFIFSFKNIMNEKTGFETKNFQVVVNNNLSDAANGKMVYNVTPPELDSGIYRLDYTVIDADGDSLESEGWFGISDFNVLVSTFDESGQEREVFSSGDAINISLNLTSSADGEATIRRKFFRPINLSISNGFGSVVLNLSDGDLPTQSGFYPLGVEAETNDGKTGFGDGYFKIRNLNIRTIAVRKNSKFSSTDDIEATVSLEKSGNPLEGAKVSLERLIRTRDWSYIANTSYNASLTNIRGNSNISISPPEALRPGHYFAEIRARYNGSSVFQGFGFQIVEDKVIITVNDEDKRFSSTDSISIDVKVTYQNDTPKNNTQVNLTGLLNLDTWASVGLFRTVNTASNGIAEFSLSASNYNPGKYAPIVSVEGVTDTIVGFGEPEFQIVPFNVDAVFNDSDSVFNIGESITLNITATGSISVEAAVMDKEGLEQDVDYSYSSGKLKLRNDLEPGEYLVEVSVTLSDEIRTRKLWFEVIAPYLNIHPFDQPYFNQNDTININYTVFSISSQGWQNASGTVNITRIENLWTGNSTAIGTTFSASGDGNQTVDLEPYSLPKGDYLVFMSIAENPGHENAVYFRIEKNISITVDPIVNQTSVKLNITTDGLSSPIHYLQCYQNNDNFEFFSVDGSENQSGQDAVLNLSGLSNGFYSAGIRIVDGGEVYWRNAYFDVRVKPVNISSPENAKVNDNVLFNLSYSGSVSTYFWVIDSFTDKEAFAPIPITESDTSLNLTFHHPSKYLYSYGNTKWEARKNAGTDDIIRITETGFQVYWPYDENRYVLNGSRNLTFGVESDLSNATILMSIKNLFTGVKKNWSNLTTHNTGWANKSFSFNLTDYLGLDFGPHDVELVLLDGSTDPPKRYFFIDIFEKQYDAWWWNDRWEYKTGETVRINIELRDVINSWTKVTPDSVDLEFIEDPWGNDLISATKLLGSELSFNVSTPWLSGNYHGELNVSKGNYWKVMGFDFYVKGNDNLDIFTHQEKWDYTWSDDYLLDVHVEESGTSEPNITVSLSAFEKMPDEWNATPTEIELSGNYSFNPANKTNQNGDVTFTIDISEANLSTGKYSGRLNLGGQAVWFDFGVRSYKVDAYPLEWEYAMTDTIEINVRARDFDGTPIEENGSVEISRIYKVDPMTWLREEIDTAVFGISNASFDVSSGEALIEMQVMNQSALNISHPHEIELRFSMDLETSQDSTGWSSFKLSDKESAAAYIVDGTGGEPVFIFSDQNYTVKVTGADEATLENIWGPESHYYGLELKNNSQGELYMYFITPNEEGRYTMEIRFSRSEGYDEWIYKYFTVGSGVEIDSWMDGNVVSGVNFTIYAELFGEGDDPFCVSGCDYDEPWFGPLQNKTVRLTAIKNLENFSSRNISRLGINATTNIFPDWMIPGPGVLCSGLSNMTSCTSEEGCGWNGSDCQNLSEHCSLHYGDYSNCTLLGCFYDNYSSECRYDFYPQEPDNWNMDIQKPGRAIFNLNPDELNLSAGKRYELVFSYSDNETTVNSWLFVQVEKFHVAISKRTENIEPNSMQDVWVKTSYLNATDLEGCDISFDWIYSEKDWEIVKYINKSMQTNSSGEAEFEYRTPTLPGQYLVQGSAICNMSGTDYEQDVNYFISLGGKGLSVDMKNRYKENENILLSINTRDRLGNPISQKLEVLVFHYLDGYDDYIYSLGGADCQVVDAAPEGSSGLSGSYNLMSVWTDNFGTAELELCPMPKGEYYIKAFPVFEGDNETATASSGGGGGSFIDDGSESKTYFEQDFIVSSAEIYAYTEKQIYLVNDTVHVDLTIYDEDKNLMNGTIEVFEAFMDQENRAKYIIYRHNESISFINGTMSVNYTINSTVFDPSQNATISTPNEIVSLFIVVRDQNSESHTFHSLIHVVGRSSYSNITTDSRVNTNSLISVNVTTENSSRYKVQYGSFFLKDNPDIQKSWMIEGGIFLDDLQPGKTGAIFKVLSPREPGTYLLGMPVLKLSSDMTNIDQSDWEEVFVTEVEVTDDLVNVSGNISYSTGTPGYDMVVRIGNSETETDLEGYFSLLVPKGKKSIIIERIYPYGSYGVRTWSMKTEPYNFQQDAEINVSFVRINLMGFLSQTLYNITSPSTDLDNMKLRMNVSIYNSGPEDIENMTVMMIARSGKSTRYRNLSSSGDNYVFFQDLYPGFEDGIYDLVIRATANSSKWYSSNFVNISGFGSINSSVVGSLKTHYEVDTYATAGDSLDNDHDCEGFSPYMCDGQTIEVCIDEEIDNNKDDDCDGKIDEDLEATLYVEWCGNGYCFSEEYESGDCSVDCSMGYCGDNICEGDEYKWCADDCSVEVCNKTNQCLEGPYFCNQWNITEYASWCESSCSDDYCWACNAEAIVTNNKTECELVGCAVVNVSGSMECSRVRNCSDDRCWDCFNQTACENTNICEWDMDLYSGDGDCKRPYTCQYECSACGSETDCLNSSASMSDASGCRWIYDSSGWCEWNNTDIPAQNGSGIIDNVWIAKQNVSWFEATIDWKCWLGNCTTAISPGMYYIMIKMGGTRMNISVNDTFFKEIDNEFGNWGRFATETKYDFTDNGSYYLEFRDCIGPDYLNWTIHVGEIEESSENLSLDLMLDDINSSVQESQIAEFRINLTNDGTTDADNISIIYMFDQNYMNITSASLQWNISNFTMLTNGSVEWWMNLGAGGDISIGVNVTAFVSGDPQHRVRVENSSGYLFSEGQLNLTINPASGEPQIIVHKQKLNASVKEGQVAEFLLNITNNGTEDAVNMTIIDLFNSTYLYYNSSYPSYDNITGNMISWFNNITAGGTILIYVNMTANNSGFTYNNLSVDNGTEIIESYEIVQTIDPATEPFSFNISKILFSAKQDYVVQGENISLDVNITVNGSDYANFSVNITYMPQHFKFSGAKPGMVDYSDPLGYVAWSLDIPANNSILFNTNLTTESPVYMTWVNLTIINLNGTVMNVSFKNISINLSLFGNVNSSYGTLSDARIRIRNNTDKSIISYTNTTSRGYYNISLIPNVYDLEFLSPPMFMYQSIVKLLNSTLYNSTNISIDLPEFNTSNIEFNNTPAYSGLYQMRQNSSVNFSMIFENEERYPVNTTLILNASEIGEPNIFDYFWTNVPGLMTETLLYNITANQTGPKNLSYRVNADVNTSNLVFGYDPLDKYEIVLFSSLNNSVPINITS